MTDASRLQHPLAVEAVQWSAGNGPDLLVRVIGRWRRPGPVKTAAPALVIDTAHGRRRFPALAEPAGAGGGRAGAWVVSFVVPAALAPRLAGRLTLTLGSLAIALPAARADPGDPAASAGAAAMIPSGPEPIVITDLRDRRPDPDDADVARAESGALLEWLELELTRSRQAAQRLRDELAVAERERRRAEQLAHAEAALRIELERDHAAHLRRHEADAAAAADLLQAVQLDARALGREVQTLRREAVARAWPLAVELELARAALVAVPRPAPAPAAGDPPGLRLERAMRSMGGLAGPAPARGPSPALAGALLRLAAERAQAVPLDARDRAHAAYVAEAIEGIASQLEAVRAVLALLPPGVAAGVAPGVGDRARDPGPEPDPDPGPDPAATGRDPGADPAATRPGPGPDPAATSPGPEPEHAEPHQALEPDRLAAALRRLREQTPPPEGSLAPTTTPPSRRWLRTALRRLLADDPALAGRVVIELVPAHAGGTVTYDIVLAEGDCRAVTVTDGAFELVRRSEPRSLDGVAFRLEGDLGGVGRLFVYGAVHRCLSPRVARVRGDRRAAAAVRRLVRRPLSLGALAAAGVRLDPALALALVASLIEPAWTVGEVFTLALETLEAQDAPEAPDASEAAYLVVCDGERPRACGGRAAAAATTIVSGRGEGLLALLAGTAGPEMTVSGASRPLALVREWIVRAQRDS